MNDVRTLISRIDQELKGEVEHRKAEWEAVERGNRERAQRLTRFDTVAEHVIALVKPRLDAFLERFKPVVKVQPSVREHTRAVRLDFASTLCNVILQFELFPDRDVERVRLECTQDFTPAWVSYEKSTDLEFPLDAVPDDQVVSWLDDRVVTFVRTYLALVRRDDDLREHLKEALVEDPVTGIRFPKFLAASSLERDGKTYYFVDEDTRRQFETAPATKS